MFLNSAWKSGTNSPVKDVATWSISSVTRGLSTIGIPQYLPFPPDYWYAVEYNSSNTTLLLMICEVVSQWKEENLDSFYCFPPNKSSCWAITIYMIRDKLTIALMMYMYELKTKHLQRAFSCGNKQYTKQFFEYMMH